MPKKNKKIKKEIKKPHKDLYHLTMLLKNTRRHITNDGSDLDSLFKNQEKKILKRLSELK